MKMKKGAGDRAFSYNLLSSSLILVIGIQNSYATPSFSR